MQFLDLLATRIGKSLRLANDVEAALFQDPAGAEIVLGDTGANGRVVLTSVKKAVSARVAMPCPNGLFQSNM